MKKFSKILLVVLCAVLLVVGSVLGTLAYLQDTTDVAKNTFTSGHVYIDLTETDWDNSSDGARDISNEYELIPGRTVDKDPTVTVKADSEDAYVYMTVGVENLDKLTAILTDASYYNNDVFLIQNLVTGYEADTWKYVGFDDDTDTYLFVYKATVSTKDAADKDLEPLFTKVTLPGEEFTNENIDDVEDVVINITAYAIQSEGFGSAAEAWGAGFSGFESATWPN